MVAAPARVTPPASKRFRIHTRSENSYNYVFPLTLANIIVVLFERLETSVDLTIFFMSSLSALCSFLLSRFIYLGITTA